MARSSHKLIWGGSDAQSRTFHLSRIFCAVRASSELLASLRHVRPGVYAIDPALVLKARQRVELALPYLEQEGGEA